MKKLKKRYNWIIRLEATLTAICLILGLACPVVLIINAKNPYNLLLMVTTIILCLILVGLDKMEKNVLKEVFFKGCENHKNMYQLEDVRLQEMWQSKLPLKLPFDLLEIVAIFFANEEGKNFIYAIYIGKGVVPDTCKEGAIPIPCNIEEIPKMDKRLGMWKWEVRDLEKLGEKIRFAN